MSFVLVHSLPVLKDSPNMPLSISQNPCSGTSWCSGICLYRYVQVFGSHRCAGTCSVLESAWVLGTAGVLETIKVLGPGSRTFWLNQTLQACHPISKSQSPCSGTSWCSGTCLYKYVQVFGSHRCAGTCSVLESAWVLGTAGVLETIKVLGPGSRTFTTSLHLISSRKSWTRR